LRHATVFCLGYRLSKHRMTGYAENLRGDMPLWLRLCPYPVRLKTTFPPQIKIAIRRCNRVRRQAELLGARESRLYVLRTGLCSLSSRVNALYVLGTGYCAWCGQPPMCVSTYPAAPCAKLVFPLFGEDELSIYNNDDLLQTHGPYRRHSKQRTSTKNEMLRTHI